MNFLKKITIENLKKNKKRTIVTIIGILLSVALITAVGTMYASALKSFVDFETSNQGNFHVSFYDVDTKDLPTIKNNRGIENINTVKNMGYAKLDISKNEYKPYAYIKGMDENSLENLSINLVEGRMPQNSNEIIIPTHLKTNGRIELKVGQKITLNIGDRVSDGYTLTQNNLYSKDANEKIVNAKENEYLIVGIMERPATNLEPTSAPGYTFVTYTNNFNDGKVDIYTRYSKEGLKDHIKITASILEVNEQALRKVYSGDVADEEEYKAYIKEIDNAKYQGDINTYLIKLETNPLKDGSMRALCIAAAIVCLIIVITSVYCIKNSFDISITEKTKQYGMLRSIGATKKQIRKNVFYEGTLLGLIGIPLGILLGLAASAVLVKVCYILLSSAINVNFKITLCLSPIAILIAVILGIITIYFSALKSARRASKVSPIISIRNSSNIKFKSKNVRSSKLIKKIFGVGGDISHKNLKRNRKKYRTTVISIIVSAMVYISLSSFMSMVFEVVESELKATKANISMFFESGVEGQNNYELAKKAVMADNIEDSLILRQDMGYIKNPSYKKEYKSLFDKLYKTKEEITYNDGLVIAISIGDDAYNKFVKNIGLNPEHTKGGAILIDNTKIQSYNKETRQNETYGGGMYSYTKGDLVTLSLDETSSTNLYIKAVTTEVPMGCEYGAKDAVYLLVSDDMFNSISNNSNGEVIVYAYSNNADKLQDDWETTFKNSKNAINNRQQNVNVEKDIFTLLGIFLYGFIIVISLIGITNVFNTITTNMELRRQEFASLKSIGMTHKEFNKMIALESIFMGFKSLFFGTILGCVMSYAIYNYLAKEDGIRYELPIMPILICALVVFVLIGIIMKTSMNKINKQNVIETIRNENI